MQFSTVALALFAAVANAQSTTVVTVTTAAPPPMSMPSVPAFTNGTTVVVVDVLTTVCAKPTVITVNKVCYTATESGQTLTITNCPCTVTQYPGLPSPVAPVIVGTGARVPAASPTYVQSGASISGQSIFGLVVAMGALAAAAAQ